MKIPSQTETAGSVESLKTPIQTTGSFYFHVPFCTKKCPYCHFYVLPNRLTDHQLLFEALQKHLEKELGRFSNLASIYFGGGTPSLFSKTGEFMAQLPYAPERTIEANPEEATFELFEKLLAQGFNRLSLGVQSLDDRSLQTLERTHSAAKARQAILDATRAGFQNISIDLMYDLPDQTLASWEYTLDQLKDLPIQHLSLYNLTIEPHTAFHKRKIRTPSSELSLRLLQTALRKLEQIRLKRYEISAFAKPGYESQHNLGYWTARPFIGFGPSAFSYLEGARFQNIAHLKKYATALKEGNSPIGFYEKLPYLDHLKELFIVRLRLREGVPPSLFSLPEDMQITLEKLKKQGFLEEKGNLFLTEKGMLFYDTVAAELI